MRQFPVEDGELVVGSQRLSTLAARVGQTPFYAYDRQLLVDRVRSLRAALPVGVKLHYAMKANPMPAVVGLMARLVDGVDVASAGELRIAGRGYATGRGQFRRAREKGWRAPTGGCIRRADQSRVRA